MIEKSNVRIPESNFYRRDVELKETPKFHQITEMEIYDPGRIMLKYDYPMKWWNLILRINNIIDPIDGLEPGIYIAIPHKKDLKRIQLEKEG